MMQVFDKDQWLTQILNKPLLGRSNYLAMYSSWWDGVVLNPHLMMIPIDDHQVHRGDAVFEAMKVISKKVYLLSEHLDRLERSMKSIELNPPCSRSELEEKITKTLSISKAESALIRLFVGRGPGSFTANPYDTQGSQLHIIVTSLNFIPKEVIEKGVSLMTSQIKAKDSFMAQIKSCNYLTNVLMKKEAVDHGADFSVGIDDSGHFTEGSTENLIILDQHGRLCKPLAAQILSGTTMNRLFELAPQLIQTGLISSLCERPFNEQDLLSAKEAMMVGTTLDVISVTKFNGKDIGSGKPGPLAQALRRLLLEDQKQEALIKA